MKNFFIFDPKLLVYGFIIIFFASYSQTFFISIFNSEIRIFYDLSSGEFGLIYSLATLFSSFFLLGFAKLIDRIDLRFYSLLIAIGLALSCLAMGISYKSNLALFFIILGLRFFGQGAMSHAGETTMARYFSKNRGKAISFSTLGGMLGVMILPFVVVKMSNFIGWRNVWVYSGLSIILLFIPLIFLILKDQLSRDSNNLKNTFNIKVWKISDVIFDKKFYIYLPITIATPFISTGLTFHQIFIIGEKNWTLDMLTKGFVFFGIFSIFGLILGGPLVDIYKAKKIVIFTLLPLVVATLILIFFDNYFFILIYMSLLGFNIGLGTPVLGSLWAELYGIANLGAVKALLHGCMIFFSALSPVVFGYMIDYGLGVFSLSFSCLLIIFVSSFLPIIYKNNL